MQKEVRYKEPRLGTGSSYIHFDSIIVGPSDHHQPYATGSTQDEGIERANSCLVSQHR